MSVIDVLEDLEAVSSRTEKDAILRSHSDNHLLKKVFCAASDPYTVYFINKFKMPRPSSRSSADDDIIVDSFLNELSKLSTRAITGNAAKALVEGLLAHMNESQQKWCQRIILKNLRCGVQESSLNKVWPNLVKSFKVALADTLKSEFVKGEGIKILDSVNYPVRIEPKLDGLRCIAVKQGGIVTFYTRNGTVLDTLPKIKAALEEADYDDVVLDGEAMGDDWNESASVLMSKKDKKDDSGIIYNVFDAVPLSDWIAQKCDIPYEKRSELVAKITGPLTYRKLPVRQVSYMIAYNEDVLKQFFNKCMDQGYEGIMLKDVTTPYRFKRSSNILKLKPVTTWEGVIVGHYDGKTGGKREGKFGGFRVVLPNGVVTRVGSGFTDAFMAEVQLVGRDSYIGRIIEIEGQPDMLTHDGLSKDGCVRFPVFIRFRDPSDVDPNVMAAYTRYES